MSASFEHYARQVMSGAARGPRAAAMRAALAAAEVPYALAARARNGLFDAKLRRPRRLPRPVISVGNITAGGTGKTPVVRWLAERLREGAREVAILSRGYKAAPGTPGDEQRMLAELLNVPGAPAVHLCPNPSRFVAGREVLRAHPRTAVFLLDDGFQHRQLARDFDLVLVNAAEPFGYGHVLPRGLLREPLGGLGRASAFLLTRVDQVGERELAEVRRVLRGYHPAAPVYESVHAHAGFRSGEPESRSIPAGALAERRWFAFCGIGDPQSFVNGLDRIGGTRVGSQFFADHHAYADADVRSLQSSAAAVGADVLVTTEKDWVKLSSLSAVRGPGAPPLWRADVRIRFRGDDEARLLSQVTNVASQG